MNKVQLRKEARSLQGTTVKLDDRSLKIAGDPSRAEFESGGEGIVHLATDESTQQQFRIKSFWEPDDIRRRRSEYLVRFKLADLAKTNADSLGGAPIGMLPSLGPSIPFAILMRNMGGENWRKLRMRAEADPTYPPDWWAPVTIRATWAYGLATAVMKMEARKFIHADVSPGNVMVNDGTNGSAEGLGPEKSFDAGDMALIDFDRFVHGTADLSELGQGTRGYAAREVWAKTTPQLGTDRTSLAILVQEFLLLGEPSLRKEDAFRWWYDQELTTFGYKTGADRTEEARRAPVHPFLRTTYPAVADLIQATVQATAPELRPPPAAWREPLRSIVYAPSGQTASKLRELTLEEIGDTAHPHRMIFKSSMRMLDLSETRFRLPASLKRDEDGAIYLAVHAGATLKTKVHGPMLPVEHEGGERVAVEIGLILLGSNGSMNVRLTGPR